MNSSRWIVIDKRLVLNRKFGDYTAFSLNDSQYAVRLCDDCAAYHQNYIKYEIDTIKEALASGELLQERLNLNATIGIDTI